ncbi:Quinone oxidoreductase [Liberibacter crescens BT-1]|uniref:Quinone oxidoreductase n=1 Tax=Liberibacter crescens (strain BT-1) TaxID=1215343 RepID=L0EXD2_LIBCB|nr:NAD(P)H-quinone oxidoreductase [Liberibacter crescens]AGA65328.1 Quinone oxidoreductase [Liberibacter crescens BT-1]AMC13257.1 NAD(P)H-quinone oxidoreductase [Liberibacter crescens]
MHLPKKMRYVNLSESGPPEVMFITTGPLPQPNQEEVLIKVHAAGINRPDIFQRKGEYPAPKNSSPILGLEVAGEIVSIGSDVYDYKIGDKVCALTNGGGYAEYCAVPESQILRFPIGHDSVKAASLPETFFTVWANLFQIAKLKPGQNILIHGGTSGIGVSAIQLASAFGAEIYATAGSEEKCSACIELGAKRAINYRIEDFYDVVSKETNQRGVNIILDMIGAEYLSRHVSLLSKNGYLIFISFLGGRMINNLDLMPIMLKQLTITGSTMRRRSALEKKNIRDELLKNVWPLLDYEYIKPIISTVLPIEQVVDAHRILETSNHIGKIILTL